VNLNCVTNRVAPGPRYKLNYDAEQYKTIHTLLNILYLQPPHSTVRQLDTEISSEYMFIKLKHPDSQREFVSRLFLSL
jgi:hypothetical protein